MDWTTEFEEGDQPGPVATGARHHRTRLIFASVMATLVLVFAIGGFGFVLGHFVMRSPAATSSNPEMANSNFPSRGLGNYQPAAATPSDGSTSSPTNAEAAKIARSVDRGLVDITTKLSYQSATAAGTGMVLTSHGLVLTNNHVIDGATSITARDVATGTVYTAKVVGYDVTSDVAVLQLQGASNLSTITPGDSNSVASAEEVVGIGNAGGVGGTPSYAPGSVVALDQSITAADQENPTGAEQLSGMIEVNASIDPGDSGGPLVNSKGDVIGMDTAASSSGGGFGFDETGSALTQAYAIPINTALSIAKLIEDGAASSTVHIGATPFLGIELSPTLSGDQGGFGYGSQAVASGVSIRGTISGTPAAKSALAPGDVITSLDGQSTSTATALDQLLQKLHRGDSVRVSYTSQSGVHATLNLQLAAGPPQ